MLETQTIIRGKQTQMDDEFEKDFLVEKDHTKQTRVRAAKIFKPNERLVEKLPTWGVLHSPTKNTGNTTGERKWYSVWEDKIIIDTMKAADAEGRSFASVVDKLSNKLNRTVESVKERQKRWIKRFSEEDRDKILAFCKGKKQAYCRDFAVRRKIDERKGTCELTEIVRNVEETSKPKPTEPQIESEDEPIVFEPLKPVQENPTLGKRASKKPIQEEKADESHRDVVKIESASENQNLRRKVELFKQSLSSSKPEDINYNAGLLHQLLRQVAIYHSVDLKSLVDGLGEEPLSLESLRQQLCARSS